jgi:hypothetical protein
MSEHNSAEQRSGQPVDELQRVRIRRWLRELSAQEFTDAEAARLVLATLLYLRGSLRG